MFKIRLCFLLLLSSAFTVCHGAAGKTSEAGAKQAQPAVMPMPTMVAPLPKVIAIETVKATEYQANNAADAAKGSKNVQVVYPGNIVRFTINNPAEFLKIRPTDQSRVVIYVNGLEMRGMYTNWYSSVTNAQINSGKIPVFKNNRATIDVVLRRTDSTQRAWVFFYDNTRNFTDPYLDVSASIGWEGMSSLEKEGPKDKYGNETKVSSLRIVYYSQNAFWLYLGFFLILLGGFAFLAVKTNAIKEGDSHGAYSLSQTQLLFWTTLSIGAFIYTLVLTDLTSSFNSSILYMIGISLSTTGIASAIDSQFKAGNAVEVKKPHHNFFQDVLTSDGISFSVQRIQIFAWNLLLGLYFIIYTIKNKSMPVFSETMLVLAGFSSLSYLGAKPPENATIKRDKEEKKTAADSAEPLEQEKQPSPDADPADQPILINSPVAVG